MHITEFNSFFISCRFQQQQPGEVATTASGAMNSPSQSQDTSGNINIMESQVTTVSTVSTASSTPVTSSVEEPRETEVTGSVAGVVGAGSEKKEGASSKEERKPLSPSRLKDEKSTTESPTESKASSSKSSTITQQDVKSSHTVQQPEKKSSVPSDTSKPLVVIPSDSKSPSSSSNSPNTSLKVSSPLKRRKSSNDSNNSGKDNKFKLEDVEKTAELDESKDEIKVQERVELAEVTDCVLSSEVSTIRAKRDSAEKEVSCFYCTEVALLRVAYLYWFSISYFRRRSKGAKNVGKC